MNHKGTIVIETERLLLRPFVMEDIEAAYANWGGDPEVSKYLHWECHRNTDDTREVLSMWIDGYKKNDFYQWAIVPKELGENIGTISIVGMNEKTDMLHFGYCIGSRWWRKGYTSEALAGILPFLFDEVGANRVESQHDPENENSGKVMLKCGLKYEGTLRQAERTTRGIVDSSVYSILKSEWEEMNKR